MATPRPKRFVAARDFTYAGRRYVTGAPLEHGLILDRLLRHGDKFAVAVKTAPAVEANPEAGGTTPPVSSPKEN